MRLVYLYGPPGVGKLTIGRELAALTGFRLLHNHLLVDLVTTLFAHESPAYFRLLRKLRQGTMEAAASEGVDIICTGVYRGTADQRAAMQRHIQPVYDVGGSVLFVQLWCEHPEWLRRLQSPQRSEMNKLTDTTVALGLLEQFDLFSSMPFEPNLRIDTTNLAATDVVRLIADRL